MFEKTLMTLAAAAAIAAAAAVSVVSLAFALYAVMRPHIGDAGASAVVAATAAVVVALAGIIAASKAGGHARRPQPVEAGLVEKVVEIVRDRPMLSAGAALAVGIFALRNPAFVSALVKGFMDSSAPPRR